MSDSAHVPLMEAVARHFFGEPNRQLSSEHELRFGTHGSKSVDLKKGVWFDHEAGQGGGPLDLIKREEKLTENRECYEWAERHGYWSNGRARPSSRKQVATYDYTDESGALLFQKVRLEPKDFRLRRPDGNGSWIWGIKGVRRVVYRLPEVVETIRNDHLILIVEGERDVDNCWRIGVPATCNFDGGSKQGKWNDALTPTFRDADVCIIVR